jgi:hypothetical protein
LASSVLFLKLLMCLAAPAALWGGLARLAEALTMATAVWELPAGLLVEALAEVGVVFGLLV